VGHQAVHVQENDTGPDDCNHAQYGAFILAAANLPYSGEVDGARLIDMSPTLLELAGFDVPPSMQGSSLAAGGARQQPVVTAAEEAVVRNRLQGLGYI
jgi:predicted AlkP superfamily phosphohydrolase/phosphomutase